MNNLSAATNLCTAMCSSFYPDKSSVTMALFNAQIDAEAEAAPKDPEVFKVAVALVMGYVEGSRSEGGTSVSVLQDKVEDAIKYWCNIYGLAAEEIIADKLRVIEDGTHLW